MSLHYQTFARLHQQKELFILPNAWNAQSAFQLQQTGFKAIGTSSAAVAKSLGYEDGEQMPFNSYLFIINRILATINLPLSVDMEMGYGSTGDEIYENICQLYELGVAGINIEDSQINASKRTLQDAGAFAKKLEHVATRLQGAGIALFINVRCDAYLLQVANTQAEAETRAKLYESSGANGLFLPCISNEKDIQSAVAATNLPINVMAIPQLPGFDALNQLGVKRVSLGNFLFDNVYRNVQHTAAEIIKNKNVSPLF